MTEVERGSGRGSFKEGPPHLCAPDNWGPPEPQPTPSPSATSPHTPVLATSGLAWPLGHPAVPRLGSGCHSPGDRSSRALHTSQASFSALGLSCRRASCCFGAVGAPRVPGRGLREGLPQSFMVPAARAGAGLSLQAPVRGVEEEHQTAAEECAQAGHQQHGHWGDTASSVRARRRARLTPLTGSMR